MPGATKERNRKKIHNREDDERTLWSLKQELKPHNPNKKVSRCLNRSNGDVNLKRKKIVKKAILQKSKTSKKKQPSLGGSKHKPSAISKKKNEKTEEGDVKRHGRSRKKRKNNAELDEASRLQRRTRYLLVKIKMEQNLIDAYSTEGWKGQSREKIRPEKELQRAMKQILMSKLGIREALHQLDLLSSEGRINDSLVASDGSVHHEHIVCAKCRLREAFPDNDIILCDGSCNRAFHQKCLDPPLSTENIPPGDEGWFCKFCKKKMEILEATNAHLGTHFTLDCNWQEVFKEEANLPDDGNSMLCLEEEWPSEDSEDDDYDPDRIQTNGSDSMSRSESISLDCSSSFLGSLEDETGIVEGERRNGSFDNNSLDLVGEDFEDDELLCRPRQRATVDYIKLYDEMFGKNATEYEQISEDEDWGPRKRKRKVKETDAAASTLMTLSGPEKKNSEEMPSEMKETKRPIFRLPCNAVEKLKLVFADNELPDRALRLSLSKQIGLEFNKVNKWFKNARYLALKARKQAGRAQEDVVSPCIQNEPISETVKCDHPDQTAPDSPKNLKRIFKRKKTHFSSNSFKIKQQRKPLSHTADLDQMTNDPGDDVSLKYLREKAKEDKKKKSVLLEAEAEMERLCEIKSRVEKLQRVLRQYPGTRFGKSNGIKSNDPSVIFVPVAELREKG